MAETKRKKVKLQLLGLDGNAFSLMGAFQRQAKKEGWSPAEIKAVLDDCQSGDYNYLLSVLMENCEDPEDDEDDEDDPEDDEEDIDGDDDNDEDDQEDDWDDDYEDDDNGEENDFEDDED